VIAGRSPLLDPLLAAPDRGGVMTDFDGTLAAIVDEPTAARPLPGVGEVLEALGSRYRMVAVISGRPVEFLDGLLPPSILISGLYGLERSHLGVRTDVAAASAWREAIDDVATASESVGPAGMGVERKGLSLTLHYRKRPDLIDVVQDWARRQAVRSGLSMRPAKMSVELHPPTGEDKGTAVEALAEGLGAVCFIGDDIGDLPAFDALDRLAATGVHTVRVGVRSSEEASEVIDRSDIVVDGPDGALAFLRSLLEP
jgi:trehalose 6-phosphate phosphatase